MREFSKSLESLAKGKIWTLSYVIAVNRMVFDAKYKPVLDLAPPLDQVKTPVKGASEALDSYASAHCSPIDLGLPEE
jgi:hypothetical protein